MSSNPFASFISTAVPPATAPQPAPIVAPQQPQQETNGVASVFSGLNYVVSVPPEERAAQASITTVVPPVESPIVTQTVFIPTPFTQQVVPTPAVFQQPAQEAIALTPVSPTNTEPAMQQALQETFEQQALQRALPTIGAKPEVTFDQIGEAFASSVDANDEKTPLFNPAKYMMRVQGGAIYLPAQARIKWFRTEHPDWSIVTRQIASEPFEAAAKEGEKAKGWAKYYCEISDTTGRVVQTATRVEYAWRKGPYFEEIAETGSVGRACQMLGYGTILDDETESLAGAATPDGDVKVTGMGNPFAKR